MACVVLIFDSYVRDYRFVQNDLTLQLQHWALAALAALLVLAPHVLTDSPALLPPPPGLLAGQVGRVLGFRVRWTETERMKDEGG